jgi:hypothetical protein
VPPGARSLGRVGKPAAGGSAPDPDERYVANAINAINAIVRPSQSARRNAIVRADVVRGCGW